MWWSESVSWAGDAGSRRLRTGAEACGRELPSWSATGIEVPALTRMNAHFLQTIGSQFPGKLLREEFVRSIHAGEPQPGRCPCNPAPCSHHAPHAFESSRSTGCLRTIMRSWLFLASSRRCSQSMMADVRRSRVVWCTAFGRAHRWPNRSTPRSPTCRPATRLRDASAEHRAACIARPWWFAPVCLRRISFHLCPCFSA